MAEEGLNSTDNKLIFIGKTLEFDYDWFVQKIIELDALDDDEPEAVKRLVHEIVPTYKVQQNCEQK